MTESSPQTPGTAAEASQSTFGRVVASPYLPGVLCMLFWSGSFVMIRGIAIDAPPIALGFWRAVVAASILTAIAWPHLRNELGTALKHWKGLLFVGILQVTLGNTMATIGVQRTPVVNASVINAMVPVMIVLYSWTLFRDRISPRQMAGIVLSFLGVMTLIARADLDVLLSLSFNDGDIWILGAVMSWGLYAVMIRRTATELHPWSQVALLSIFGLISMAPLYAWEHFTIQAATLDRNFVLAVLYMAVLSSVLALVFWNRTLRLLGPTRSAPFQHLIPVFSFALGILLLGETLHAYHGIGAVLIAGGIWLTAVVRRPG